MDFGKRFSLVLGFAPGFYDRGEGCELGSMLEFKSFASVSYRLKGMGKLSLQFSHLSNGGISTCNPGAESLGIQYEIPILSGHLKTTPDQLVKQSP
jgi:lipid A 3-O-deacylase